MRIEIGKVVHNRTFKYLHPCIRGYGEKFFELYKVTHKLGIGIGDYLRPDFSKSGRYLFIMMDKHFQPTQFNKFLTWITHQDYYVDDYVASPNINSRRHMFVLSVPPEYTKTYDNFIAGKYSEMYSRDKIDKLFKHKNVKDSVPVLLKEHTEVVTFRETIKREFNEMLTFRQIMTEGFDYDIPPKCKDDIFHYEGKNTFCYAERG